jgi:hypothetical protein
MGLEQSHIQHIGTTAGPTPEFYGIQVNLNRDNPDFFRMSMNTALKEMQLTAPAFGLLRLLPSYLTNGQPVTHPTIPTGHPCDFRQGNKLNVQRKRVHGKTLLKKGSTFIHSHATCSLQACE